MKNTSPPPTKWAGVELRLGSDGPVIGKLTSFTPSPRGVQGVYQIDPAFTKEILGGRYHNVSMGTKMESHCPLCELGYEHKTMNSMNMVRPGKTTGILSVSNVFYSDYALKKILAQADYEARRAKAMSSRQRRRAQAKHARRKQA